MPMFFQTFTATAPVGDRGVDRGVGALGPAGLAEALHREGGGEVEVLRDPPRGGQRRLRLKRQRREIGVVDVDRQELEIVLAGDVEEGVASDIVVHVGIELGHAHEVGIAVGSRNWRCTRRAGRQGDAREDGDH